MRLLLAGLLSSLFALELFSIELFSAELFAQDARDEDIFGEKNTAPAAGDSSPAPIPAAQAADTGSRTQNLVDTLQIGGRLEVRAATGQLEQQKLPKASNNRLRSADIYFDTRPNKDMRVFLRTRFEEQDPSASSRVQANPAATGAAVNEDCGSCVDAKIDELWFKWVWNNQAFFTLGKQHLKWGSSRFWNPTDFTAREVRDPFALFDRRLGQDLLKIHIPQEKQGHNHYLILQFDDAQRNDDVALALRSEFSVGGSSEFAVSLQSARNRPQRFGLDLSSALGPFDVNIEAASSRHVQRQFYRGELDPERRLLPEAYTDRERSFEQVVGGIRQTYKYSDEDNFTWGLEYFWNELGYDERALELYSLILGESSSLFAGRRYAGVFLALPTPGSWNETSFFANALGNLSDESFVGRLTATWELMDAATFEAYVSRCVGDLGELCFKVPQSYTTIGQFPGVSEEVKQLLSVLPTRRTMFTAGAGLSIVF